MTVRELAMANTMSMQPIYVVCNGRTIAGTRKEYIDSIKDWILDSEIEGYQAVRDDDLSACIYVYISEVNEDGAV